MSQLFSEINKVVCGTAPSGDIFTTVGVQTDIVDMESYKRCTFLLMGGAGSSNTAKITVHAGETAGSAAVAMAFKYRRVSTADTYGALQDATATGFNVTKSATNQYYIVEVDAASVAAASTTGNFDHVALTGTDAAAGDAVFAGCVVAVLSEPRYPQAILDTAIG